MEAKRSVELKVFAEEVFGGAAEFFERAGFGYFGVSQAECGGLVERARLRVFEPFVNISFEKDAGLEPLFSFFLAEFFVVNFSLIAAIMALRFLPLSSSLSIAGKEFVTRRLFASRLSPAGLRGDSPSSLTLRAAVLNALAMTSTSRSSSNPTARASSGERMKLGCLPEILNPPVGVRQGGDEGLIAVFGQSVEPFLVAGFKVEVAPTLYQGNDRR
ncbi:MAG: hypothetical protein ACREAM_07660 [Blastocatellia bacterium]